MPDEPYPAAVVTVDGSEYRLNTIEARYVALLIGTGMCHVTGEAPDLDTDKVESVKQGFQESEPTLKVK